MALTQISTGGVKDDAVTAGKIPANAVGSSEIAKPIDLADDEKVRLGTGNDSEIYHDGSHSFIKNSTGNLQLMSDEFRVKSNTGNEAIIQASLNGAVELYYDGSKKLETTSTGVNITGKLLFDSSGEQTIKLADDKHIHFGSGADLKIYHDGTDNYIYSDNKTLYLNANGSTISINPVNAENSAKFLANGAVELYHNGSKKFDTTSTGVTVTGTVSDSKGDLRSIPLGNITSAHTLVAADAGKSFTSTAGVTFPNSVFTAGQAITIINNSASDITLTQGSGATLYNTADGATGNRTLAARGMATALYISASVAYISGAGLS